LVWYAYSVIQRCLGPHSFVSSVISTPMFPSWMRREFFPKENLPASTLIGVAALAVDGLLIEIEAVAAMP